ncbi:phage tail domain-containing protein [Streptomyces sp. NPDC056638]|uniref:phage tail domain-containing protein n=1 Tax=Streptomyces sp. NPDC056638 TaxID=3345887 RepID=UPI0036C90E5F
MPPFALSSDESPNLDGAIFRSARASSREIMLPVYLYGIDRQTVNNLKRKFFQALNPKRGYCLISFTEGSGRTRKIAAYYKGGMEGSEGEDNAGFTWAKYGLTFTAMDPWFYPDMDQSRKWSFGVGSPFLSTTVSFIPLNIAAGVIGNADSEVKINNPGDIEAWPVWQLQGAIKSFSLISPLGETIKASAPADGSDLVPAGRTLTIDTRPGKKTVKDNTGANYWSKLAVNPQFWPIDPGETTAKLTVVTGAGNAAVILTFSPRYASYV